MKRIGKILTVVCAAVLAFALGIMTVGCSKAGTYTAECDSLSAWDYNFVSINAFGDEAGVGLMNLDNWGDKKLKLGSDGHCVGEGLTYTISLDVDGEGAYTLDIIMHIIGDGNDYSGSGDFTYSFQGTYEEVDGGYKLSAPTYLLCTCTGSLVNNAPGGANYLPSSGYSYDSNGVGDASGCTRVVKEHMLTTIFKGATFKVSGTEITEVTDIVW